MTRTGEEAIAVARQEHRDGVTFGVGMCLQRVRLCYDIPALYTDAATAWLRASGRHPQADPARIPRGVPVFWTGGSAGHGHVAIATGDSECWSTDIVHPGRWDKVPVERIARDWGLRLVGWTDDLNGVLIHQADTAPRQEDPNMALLNDLRAVAKKHNVSLVKAARVLLNQAAENAKKNGQLDRLAKIREARRALKEA